MKNLKRILAVILTVAMLASVAMVPVFAADETAAPAAMTDGEKIAIVGLLKGDSEDGVTEEYLAKSSTRMQMAILYARWLDFEAEAYGYEEWEDDENFLDAESGTSLNEANMLAYYFANPDEGFIGTGDGMFSPQDIATNKQLLKVLLTAMGYPYGDDYDWDDILDFAAELGIEMGASEVNLTNNGIASALVQALEAKTADDETFAQYLISLDVVTAENLTKAGINWTGEKKEAVDTSVLKVDGISATNFSEVEITFNQAVNKDSVVKEAIRIDGNKLGGNDKIYIVSDYGEGSVVRVYAADGFVGTQNEKRTIAVSGIKTATGVTMNSHSQEILFRDSTPPTVEKIVSKGNTRLDIYFSEPIAKTAAAETLGNYQINERSISATKPELNAGKDTDTSRIITIKNIRTTLVAGEYTLGVFGSDNKIVDTAGNSMGYQRINFTIVDDTEGPVAQKVLDPVYPNKVQIEFDEEITEDATISWTENSRTYTSTTADVDGNVATFEFTEETSSSKILPFRATTITLKGAKDYSGNAAQAPLTFDVTAVTDSERPTVVDSGSEKEGKIYVKFSKKVVGNSGTWTVKNSDGDKIYDYEDAIDPDDDKTILLTTLAGKDDLMSAGTYTITVKGVKDMAKPTANELIEVTFDVTVPDTTAPSINSAYYSTPPSNMEEVINLYFSEKLDYGSAVARGNYQYTINNRTYDSLPTTAKVELLSGERLVRISFPKKVDATNKILSIKANDVEDLAGNKASSLIAGVASSGEGSEIKTAVSKSKTKIELTLTSALTAYDDADFSFFSDAAGKEAVSGLSVSSTELDGDGKKLTLHLNKELSADGKYNKKDIYLKVEDNDLAVAKGGTSVVEKVTDGIAPSLEAIVYGKSADYAQGKDDTITLLFDETVKLSASATSWNSIFNNNQLAVDGKTVANGPDYIWTITADASASSVDGTFAVWITFSKGVINRKDVTVSYTPGASDAIIDMDGNEVKAINDAVEVKIDL